MPSAFVRRAREHLKTLGCGDATLQSLTNTLRDIALENSANGAEAIGSVLLFLVATAHSATSFPEPQRALPPDKPKPSITPLEWLLLACAERAASVRPDHDDHVGNAVIETYEASIACADTLRWSQTSPLVSYALGPILALCTGRVDDERTNSAGANLGKLLRLLFEARTVTSSWALAPRPVLLGAFAEEEGLGDRFLLGLAQACKPLPDRLPMLAVFGDKRLAARIDAEVFAWTASITDMAAELSLPNGLDKQLLLHVKEISSEIERRSKSARFFGLAPITPAKQVLPELLRTLTLLRGGLLEDPEQREAWDIQRWGGHFGERAVAKMFPCGLIALALAEAGEDIQAAAKSLVIPTSVDGYRYFADFRAIPPDADDLGLSLQLFARLSERDEITKTLAWPLEVLVRNTGDDGGLPVWFLRDLREPLPENAPQWLGSRCLAVSANLLIGLAESRVPLPDQFFERSLAWVLRTWEAEGMNAVFFYGAPFTHFALARLVNVADTVVLDPKLREGLQALAKGLVSTILKGQQPSGGFGGVLATALQLGALAFAGEASFDPGPAITFLAARQDPDGLFPREPLYVTPGKDDLLSAHGSRLLTAAACLYALHLVRKRFFSAQSASTPSQTEGAL